MAVARIREITLSWADMKFRPPVEIVELITRASDNLYMYPSGNYTALRMQFAEYMHCAPGNIVCGNGASELIDLVTRAFGQKVLIPIPTFLQFEQSARNYGGEAVLVNCLSKDSYSLQFTNEQLCNATLIWICNPNNPTGTLIKKEDIIAVLGKTKGIVAVDECFFEYAQESAADLISRHENLIVIRSLSKTWGLSGIRLGYLAASPSVAGRLESSRQRFNVNLVAEEVGKTIFRYKPYYSNCWQQIARMRADFAKECKALHLTVLDSHANFVLIRFRDAGQCRKVVDALAANGIRVFTSRDMQFSGLDDSLMRVSMGTAEEMEILVKVLSRSL